MARPPAFAMLRGRDNARMHICHIITRLIVGGAQENTILSCEGLAERGHRVTLISGPTTGPEGSLVQRARDGAYELVELPSLLRAIRPLADWRCRRELARLLRELRPDVVHTHSSKAGILGRFAARDAGVPQVVHTIHGMSFNRTQPAPVRAAFTWLERRAARLSGRIITVADAMIEQSVRAGLCAREKMTTVYSGMEVERFDPDRYDRAGVRDRLGISPDAIVVGTVARLFRKKGYEQLIPIMEELASDPRLHFLWIGDGAQRSDYEAELRRRGLEDRTTLTGLVPPDEVPDLLAACDLLAHTSQWEGLPRVVVQALLMRVPAVAFEIDGTPEVVLDGQTGRLVALNDLRGFALAARDLAGDSQTRCRMGAAGRERCLAMFDHRRMVERLEAIYVELTRGNCA